VGKNSFGQRRPRKWRRIKQVVPLEDGADAGATMVEPLGDPPGIPGPKRESQTPQWVALSTLCSDLTVVLDWKSPKVVDIEVGDGVVTFNAVEA